LKFILYRVNGKKKKGNHREKKVPKYSIERILFFSFICIFFLLIIVQTALVSPSIKAFVSTGSEFEGVPLGVEEFLYREGDIKLQILSGNGSSDIKALVNGDEVAAFSSKNISLKVKDGDVVEIDGSSVRDETEVGVVFKSENISDDCLGKSVIVKSNIKKLIKVKIQE
jgi:hypothetical protein